MLYVVQRDWLRPRTGPEALRRMEAALPARLRHSPLGGAWVSDIGPLNHLLHVWPYTDLADYTRVQAALAAEPGWPPPLDDLLLRSEVELHRPLPGPPMLQPGRHGPLYELRRYRTRADGGLARYRAGWQAKLGERLALSPLALASSAELGAVHTLVQLWPYASFAQRSEVRRSAVETGVLPPPGATEALVAMENAILLPAPYSPMQ